MRLVSSRLQSNNPKLYFSKYEISKIFNCYSIGVAKGDWKDYALGFNSNEAMFFFYKHTYSSPNYTLTKLKEKRKRKIIYKLSIENKENIKFENLDSLITSIKRSLITIL